MKIKRREFLEKSAVGVGGLLLGENLAGQVRAPAGVASGETARGARGASLVEWRTRSATVAIDAAGALSVLAANEGGRHYLAPGQPAPLLSVRLEGRLYAPTQATWTAATHRLILRFAGRDVTVVLQVAMKPTHVVFEVTEVRAAGHIDLVLWGPYPTTIGDIIGETVGVVRDAEFALGLQALNAKTLGGFPSSEDDIQHGFTATDPGHYPDLPPALNQKQLFRGDTAKPTAFGSVLQAYCRNRGRDRIIRNWGQPKYLAPAFPDGGIVGSKIALFGCPASDALATLGAIEVAEGLPHPLLDGVWGKVAPQANCSYLITDYGEESMDRAIAMTKRAGLQYVYNSSPFQTWGHFRLKPALFPHGRAGLRVCAEKARRAGLRIGFHTLSNFITPNDPYVTPKPDPRLARIGSSVLTAAVDAVQKEIPVAAPDFFAKPTTLNTVVIGEELIRYDSVSSGAPWRLLNCRRGAWGTRAAAHPSYAPVAKLMDHPYKVFLTNADLSEEVARNIAALCNDTGARQLSFDGLEGNWSTGMGQYGRTLFTQAWYDALSPATQGQVINDASNPGHFNWHIYTRMNWGEPWYAGFRESQTLYRFKNQLYFERNLMPRMLGWFALRPETSLADTEWLLARAAGFDAGFALVTGLGSKAQLEADPTSVEAASRWGAVPTILAAVNQWETARLAGAFPPEVKARLRDNTREFQLTAAGPSEWDLHEVHLARFTHDCAHASPTPFRYRNQDAPQTLQWFVQAKASRALTNLTVRINGHPVLDLTDRALPPGHIVRYTGGSSAVLCDAHWRELARLPVDVAAARIGGGRQDVQVGCAPQAGAKLKVELHTLSVPTRLRAPRAKPGPNGPARQ